MVRCSACGSDNPTGHQFCEECGSALQAACPSCGQPVSSSAKFCGVCGTRLSLTAVPDPAQPAAQSAIADGPAAQPLTERRVCSVLFADLVGFTPLTEARDPEEVRELLSRYFDTARTVITRYGGVVEKFIGDAVMAVWGTPVAAEGDAERAVRAGLDLVAAISALGADVGAPGLALRAGVVTGEVAASLGAVGEGMVAGDAVNTAARVQSTAAPGTVWVDTATQRLAAAGIGFRGTGSHALKGKAEPVELWEATRVLSSVGGAQRVDGLEAPMIGRDAEDRTLRELFHASLDRRTPRVITVTGAAGTGKSRLGWEFEKYVDGLADVVNWHRGRCLSYGDGVAYWALAEAIRQRFGISSEDAISDATAKFLTGLEQWLPSPDERDFVGTRLGRLLGLTHPGDTGGALGQDELFAGWRLFLERMADREPVIVLIEDAHHADDGLLDFVENVADWSRQSPIYVVLLGRLELIEHRPSLAGGRNRTSLTLDPLDERSMNTLLQALVRDMPAAAVSAIVEQAQGNPLFAVETIRSLIDRDVIVPIEGEYRLIGDVGALAVPDSLHGLLAARLDALPAELRGLVADAAVLGTSFPAEALVAVSGRPAADVITGLTELVRREVLDVSTDPLSPERGSYVFAQNMLRQVAYDTLSRRDRRARHLAVAEHLQNVFTAGGDEIMDVVAQHYLDALDAVSDEDDDGIRQRALTALTRAGERSERAGAQLRAAGAFDQAASLVSATDELAAARLWERAASAYTEGDRSAISLEVAQRARRAYLVVGERRAAARVQSGIGHTLSYQGRLAEARVALEEAVAELRAEPDLDTVEAMRELALTVALIGAANATALAGDALILGQAIDAPLPELSRLFAGQGVAMMLSHRRIEATAALRFAAELAHEAGDLTSQARAQLNLSAVFMASDFSAAAAAARAARELSQQSGFHRYLEIAASNLGTALFCAGEWDQAMVEIASTLEQSAGFDGVELLLAALYALRGDLDQARELLALPRMRASDEMQDLASIAWLDAVVAAESGDPAGAVAILASMFIADADPELNYESVFLSWPLAVRCAFEISDTDAVRRLVAAIESRPIGHIPPILRASLALTRARLSADEGQPVKTVEAAFIDAIAQLRSAGSPYHLAHGLLDHAEYLQVHERDDRSQIDEAASIGDHLGAVGVIRRVAALNDRVGHPA